MPTSGTINGTNLALYVDVSGTLKKIANLTSNDAGFQTDMIETTSKSSGGNKEYMYGHHGGTYGCEGRFMDDSTPGTEYGFEDLYDAQRARNTLTVVFTTNASGDLKFEASCLISNLQASAPDNDAAGFTCDLQITGAVTKGTVA